MTDEEYDHLMSLPKEERPLYETKALPASTWKHVKDRYIIEGWDYRQPPNESVVYVRKHISGPKSSRKGWRP